MCWLVLTRFKLLPEFLTDVLASDGSREGLVAARAAADIAFLTGSDLCVIRIWSAVGWEASVTSLASAQALPQDYFTQREEDARQDLEKLLHHIEDSNGYVTEASLQVGDFVSNVLRLCQQIDAGLLILSGHRCSFHCRLFRDNATEGVIRYAPCPVLLVRGDEYAWPPAYILIGEDVREERSALREFVLEIGMRFPTEHLLVRTYPSLPSMECEENQRSSGGRRALQREQEIPVASVAFLHTYLPTKRGVGTVTDVILNVLEANHKPTLIAINHRSSTIWQHFHTIRGIDKMIRAVGASVLIYRDGCAHP
jgi:nucleotide-binding universal stress UspA family protein